MNGGLLDGTGMSGDRAARLGYVRASAAETVARGVPRASLRGKVLAYWGFSVDWGGPRWWLEVPSGAVTLMVGLGGRWWCGDALAGFPAGGGHASVVCGMRPTAVLGVHAGRLSGLGVMLTPVAAYAVCGMPLSELSGGVVDLADVLGAQASQLAGRLDAVADWRARFALVDGFLAARLRDGPRCSPEVAWAWRRMCQAGGRVRVGALAGETGWSARHLARGFGSQIGIAPKAACGVLRLQNAIRLAETGADWAAVAHLAGYYDQSHLCAALRSCTGYTPARFRQARLDSVEPHHRFVIRDGWPAPPGQ